MLGSFLSAARKQGSAKQVLNSERIKVLTKSGSYFKLYAIVKNQIGRLGIRIYKSSNIRIVGIISLAIIVSALGLSCLSLPGSLEEKNDYDLSSPQKALASYIDICKKADKEAYIDVMSKERLREMEDWIREVKMEPGKFHIIENYSILKEDQIDDFAAIYTKVKYTSDEWAGLGA